MRFLRVLPVAVLALMLALWSSSAGPVSAQPACGTITTSITLTGDCTGPMVIAASNVRINLNGFAVVNSVVEGILIVDQTNVRVKNGSLTNNSIALRIAAGAGGGGGGHDLSNLQVMNNTFGIIITPGNNSNRVRDNMITGSVGEGLLAASDGNRINGNDVSNNPGFGIIVSGQNNKIHHNTALGNGIRDLQDNNAGCDRNRWQNNTFGTASPGCIQ